MCDKMTAMEPTTGGGSLPSQWTGFPEYIGREVAPMTAYEIISIFIGILALLMSFGREILERRMMKELDLLYTTNVEADI